MKLPEYKAKELFGKYGINIMKGIVADEADAIADRIEAAKISYPVVIKAQIPAGGRGKAGGVKFAEDGAGATDAARAMLGGDIGGHTVEKLLVAEKLELDQEWYLSITIDRASKCPLVIFSASGGADIEQTAKTNPESIVKITINPLSGIADYTVRYIIGKSGIPASYVDELAALLGKLYGIFTDYSCLVAEINPLAVPKDGGGLVALDAKIEIDDDAVGGLSDMAEFAQSQKTDPRITEAAKFGLLYIPLESEGEIGVISNGSGMLMSCIDQFAKKGMKVGAALDLGGGATAGRVKEAVRIMLESEGIHTLFLCIFGGITRCDEVANGVREALGQLGPDKSIALRMEGTNKEKGFEILRGANQVAAVGDIPDAVNLIYERSFGK
jgi:succinyl-CoA synthetase beta subunit